MKVKSLPFRNITFSEGKFGLYVPNRLKVDADYQSILVTSTVGNNNDSTVSPGGRDFSRLPFDIVPNVDYTFLVELEVVDKLKGQKHQESLQMTFALKDDAGVIHWHYGMSNKALNEYGKQLLVMHLNVPKNSTGILRLNSGMLKNQGKVKWSNLSLVNQNIPVEKLLDSDFTGLINYDGESITISNKYSRQYGKKLASIFQNNPILEELKIENSNIIKSDGKFDKIVAQLDRAETLKDKDKIISILNENLDYFSNMFDIKFNSFISATNVYGGENVIERLTILNWVHSNLKVIKEMVGNNTSKKLEQSWERLPVFVFWSQGIDGAPELIKATVKKISNQVGENLHLITKENYKYYVDVPQDIKKLTNIANLSDYLRVALLEKYGGIWLDATLLIGNNFYEKLQTNSLINENSFLMAGYDVGNNNVSYVSWFMATKEIHNYASSMIRASLRLWMRDHEQFIDYLHIYHLINALNILDNSFSSVAIKGVDALDSYVLHHHLLDTQYSNMLIKYNLDKNIVNKLNHKFDKRRLTPDSLVASIVRDDYDKA